MRVCVFCGSRSGASTDFVTSAQKLGAALAKKSLGLVYGGASIGLMGAVADAALASGGEVIGVIPSAMVAKEIAHSGLTQLHVVTSMHERKAMMEQLSDAFVALPGGLGTFEEMLEILTWAQLGLHRKPTGFLNVGGYFDPLLQQLQRGRDLGFIPHDRPPSIVSEPDPEKLLNRLFTEAVSPTLAPKWLSRDES